MLVYIRHFDTSLDVVYSAPPITIPITVVYVEALCSFLSFYAPGLTVWSLSLLSVFKFSSSLSMFFFSVFIADCWNLVHWNFSVLLDLL